MTNNYTTMIRRIGSTTYKVKVYFKDSGETMEDKILRIVRNEVLENGETGVYGRIYHPDADNYMPVANPANVQTGPAFILTTTDGNTPQMYQVEIERINLTAADRNKNMVIRITDSRLLSVTGGIVAGMSGSPLIQNGMLVGAVTHVFVNNVEKGYAIFARNMLDSLDKVVQKDKAA